MSQSQRWKIKLKSGATEVMSTPLGWSYEQAIQFTGKDPADIVSIVPDLPVRSES